MVTASINRHPRIRWYLNQSIHPYFLILIFSLVDDLLSACLNFSNKDWTASKGSKGEVFFFLFILSEYE